MIQFDCPDNEYSNSFVSLELRYGMCDNELFDDRLDITFDSWKRDLFIEQVYNDDDESFKR